QDVDFASGNPVENAGVRPLAAGSIDIHSRHSRRGKSLAEQPLHLLGAKSALSEIPTAAADAVGAWILLVQTVVADESLRVPVMGERDAAVGTGRDCAALDALDERRISAAVEEEYALLAT